MTAGEVQARVNPEGFVAQRFEHDGHWVLTHLTEAGIQVQVLNDDQVADWPRLGVPVDESENEW